MLLISFSHLVEFVHSSKCQLFFLYMAFSFNKQRCFFSLDLSLRFVPIIARDNFIPGHYSTQLAILALMGHQHVPWGNPLLSELYWSSAVQSATDFFFCSSENERLVKYFSSVLWQLTHLLPYQRHHLCSPITKITEACPQKMLKNEDEFCLKAEQSY